MRRLVTLLAALALAACASAPNYVPINRTRISQLTPAEVWTRLHIFLQDQGIDIIHEDQAAGLIDARREVKGGGLLRGLADCGRGGLEHAGSEILSFTILVRPAPDGSRVTVSADYQQLRRGALGRTGETVACNSTGAFETAVLNVASGQPMESAVISQMSRAH